MAQEPGLVPEVVLSIEQPVLTPAQEQEKWLHESIHAVATKAAMMRRCMEAAAAFRELNDNSFLCVINAAAGVLDELSTGLLAPRNYYELYVKVFDELYILIEYLGQEYRERGRPLESIYEVVQYTGHILPRLYLLIVAGAIYIDTGEGPVLEILWDLIEMCKGVQHPTRGLFLRHFLLTMMKGKLPGDPNLPPHLRKAAPTADVLNTAEFMIQNFKEMLWLWIRMETKSYQKNVNDRNVAPQRVARRMHWDRQEIEVLVGMNLERISQLDGINLEAYKNEILPKLLSIIVMHQEPLAQQYLFEVIVQVFPDEFHLATLDILIQGTQNLILGVNLREVFHSLMDRLSNYVCFLKENPPDAESFHVDDHAKSLFDTLLKQFEHVAISYDTKLPSVPEIKFSSSPPPRNPMLISTYIYSMSSLAHMSMKIDPLRCDADVAAVLHCIAEKIFVCTEAKGVLPLDAVEAAEKLLLDVIVHSSELRRLLEMDSLAVLTSSLPFKSRRTVARVFADALLSHMGSGPIVQTIPHAARLFDLLDPLLCDQCDAPVQSSEPDNAHAEAEFVEEQQMVCRVLHALNHADPAIYLKMLSGMRKLLAQGGPRRLLHTFPTLASLYLRAALLIYTQHKQPAPAATATDPGAAEEAMVGSHNESNSGSSAKLLSKALCHLHAGDGRGILEVLAVEAPISTLYQYVTAAEVADTCEHSDLSYEFYTEGLTLYEENAANTREQIEVLKVFINSLYSVRGMSEENYDVLATKLCQHASRLLKKQDQSRLMAHCATLFHRKTFSKETQHRVEDCLQRALKIAQHVQATHQLPLYVDLLNTFLHFYASKHAPIDAHYLKTLLDQIHALSADYSDLIPGVDANRSGKVGELTKTTIGLDHSGEKHIVSAETYAQARIVFRSTIKYIQSRQIIDARWQEIEI